MYKYLLLPLVDFHGLFNVFRYITFRIGMAAMTAMVLTIVLGPWVIRRLQAFKAGQEIQEDCKALHDIHKKKQGTPTMGGLLFVFSVVVSTLFWGDISRPYVLISVVGILLFGIIGFVDDYLKIKRHRSKGLSAWQKFTAQSVIALALGIYLMEFSSITHIATEIYVPFVKGTLVENSSWVYLLFIVIVITGSSNGVNLTDGLDGLAMGCTIICALTFTAITYIVGNKLFTEYLLLEYIRDSADLSVFCASMVGAGLGFLWYNTNPAEVFMGDTGALSIGGALGLVAILIKKELYLILIGGVFVLEALSVILQVSSFKLTGKRIFLCAPFHHHLELKGWSESKVTVRLWILAAIFGLVGLCSLKLR